MTAHVIRADARDLPLPDGSVDLVITSPPYFGLRSYTDNGEGGAMADPLIPPQQAKAALPRMEAAGLGWLTPILRRMIDGDPWQEGQFAVEITEAWKAASVRDKITGEAPATAEPEPDMLTQALLARCPELAGRVHYVNGRPWCDGVNHTTMCDPGSLPTGMETS